MVDDFDAALQSAKIMARNGEHAKATEQLDKVSATHAPGKGLKAWNEAATAAEKVAPQAFRTLAQIDRLLADPELRLSRSVVAGVRQRMTSADRCWCKSRPGP
jgi:hypothetical protein